MKRRILIVLSAIFLLWVVLGIAIFLWVPIAHAERSHLEKWYQERWCLEHGGQVDVVFPDHTRCDCITLTHAIEFDFADKWAEAIGQALHYSLQAGKRAGIVLIIENPDDTKYMRRVRSIIQHFRLPIDVWISVGEPCR